MATRRVLCTIEETLDAVAQAIDRFVDGMLHLPRRCAGDDGLAAALLDVAANGFDLGHEEVRFDRELASAPWACGPISAVGIITT
jgi:hypothetical protein